jgi:hypothetical protein
VNHQDQHQVHHPSLVRRTPSLHTPHTPSSSQLLARRSVMDQACPQDQEQDGCDYRCKWEPPAGTRHSALTHTEEEGPCLGQDPRLTLRPTPTTKCWQALQRPEKHTTLQHCSLKSAKPAGLIPCAAMALSILPPITGHPSQCHPPASPGGWSCDPSLPPPLVLILLPPPG